jgi:hypothetical protein
MKFLKSIFNLHEGQKQLLFIILVSFLVSFLAIRFFSTRLFGGSIFIGGYQIHHFYFGVLFLAVGGLIGTLSSRQAFLRVASAYIGLGLGLFADEIELLLSCTTEYRRDCAYDLYSLSSSYDVMGTIAVILILLLAATDEIDKLADKFFAKLNTPVSKKDFDITKEL